MPWCLDEADPGEELLVPGYRLEVKALVVRLEVGAVEGALEAEGPFLLRGAADQPRVRLLELLDVARVVGRESRYSSSDTFSYGKKSCKPVGAHRCSQSRGQLVSHSSLPSGVSTSTQ
jgi:hypothetical protein